MLCYPPLAPRRNGRRFPPRPSNPPAWERRRRLRQFHRTRRRRIPSPRHPRLQSRSQRRPIPQHRPSSPPVRPRRDRPRFQPKLPNLRQYPRLRPWRPKARHRRRHCQAPSSNLNTARGWRSTNLTSQWISGACHGWLTAWTKKSESRPNC